MKLIQGNEDVERIKILLTLTSITSEKAQQSLIDYFSGDYNKTFAASLNGVRQSNLSRNKKILNKAAEKVEKIKEIDWAKFKKSN